MTSLLLRAHLDATSSAIRHLERLLASGALNREAERHAAERELEKLKKRYADLTEENGLTPDGALG